MATPERAIVLHLTEETIKALTQGETAVNHHLAAAICWELAAIRDEVAAVNHRMNEVGEKLKLAIRAS